MEWNDIMQRSPDWQAGYDRLMTCLMHDDDAKCEVCGPDKMSRREKIYYAVCWLVLALFVIGFCAWLLLSTYPPILYP